MTAELQARFASRQERVGAIIECCRQGVGDSLPLLLETLDELTWEEVDQVMPHLPLLGKKAVPRLCGLLKSQRKQTITAVTATLAAIGDARACKPLVALMEAQAGKANAVRARDALIALGSRALPSLLMALGSRNWEVRYHAVQCLGRIGDPLAIGSLTERMIGDQSGKVKEAAMEALMLIPSVDEDASYATHTGFGHDWDVDVINADQNAVLWRFDVDALQAGGIGDPEMTCLRALLQAYETIEVTVRTSDVLVLTGPLEDEDGRTTHFGVAVAANEERLENAAAFFRAVDAALRGIPGYCRPEDYWLGSTTLVPRFHLRQDKVLKYDDDNRFSPDDVIRDFPEWYGTGLTFGFAKAALDAAWLCRDQLAQLVGQGIFRHIPAPPAPEDEEDDEPIPQQSSTADGH